MEMQLIHSSIKYVIVCPKVSQTSLHQTHLKGLLKHSLLGPEQNFSKFSRDADTDAAGLGPHLASHWPGLVNYNP